MAKRRHKRKKKSERVAAARSSRPPVSIVAPEPTPVITSLPGWRVLLQDSLALTHDTLMYSGRALRRCFGRRARLGYLVVGVVVLGVGVFGLVNATTATLKRYAATVDSPIALVNAKNTGTTILDRNGVVLFQAYGAVDRTAIPLSQMPASIKQATIATEDPDFYNNPGFSWRGTLRAAFEDVIHKGTVQGGSTITQQLVKTTLLSDQKSLSRKYKELVLSVDLEHHYSKNQILEMYLNSVYYGEGSYGIQSAAETYFHTSAQDLTVGESAMLAGLPQSPSIYDPNVNLAAATDRRNYVLSRMAQLGDMSSGSATKLAAVPIVASSRDVSIKAPWFVFYVLDQLRNQYGEAAVEQGGLTVTTTLDYTKQVAAQQIVQAQVTKLASHHVSNAGLVSLNPHNGDILTMVGSVDYSAPGFGQVNVTLAQLQPGSSFKPIAYVTAFEKGWNGATEVIDKPMSFPEGNGQVYTPENYDLKFRGPVTLRRALSNSLNIPAVQVLQYAGITPTIATAHAMGIQAPSLENAADYGLSLVLGAGDVRPIDMASVYGAFANNGMTVTPRAILSVANKQEKDITKPVVSTSKQVIDPRYAYMVTNILSDNKARQEEFGTNSPLQLDRPAAVKTGTTNDFRDNWTIGYTPDLVTAVWAGNNDHTPMIGVDGVTGAAPIWHDYMEMALAGTPVANFVEPAGLTSATVCNTDGGLAAPGSPNAYTEVFIDGTVPTKPCGATTAPTAPVLPGVVTAPSTPTAIIAQAPATTTTPGLGGGTTPTPVTPPPAVPVPPTPPTEPTPPRFFP